MTGKVQSGSIVLFHNAGEHTPEALPDILNYLLSEGYDIVPISKILLSGDYTIDHTGRQCPKCETTQTAAIPAERGRRNDEGQAFPHRSTNDFYARALASVFALCYN